MVHLYTPASESELLLLKSLFDGAGIRYFVRNEAFGSLAPGPQLEMWNRNSIHVPEAHFEEAIALVREFHRRTAVGAPLVPARATFGDRLRGLVSSVLFGWLRPRRETAAPPDLRLIKNDRPEPAPPAERPPLRLV